MFFDDLHQRLIESARQRVRSGQVSERRLARICDISQPHMHNVLKNVRALSPASADRLMRALGLTVADLLWRYPGEIEAGIRAVPLLRSRLGPGGDAVLTAFRGYMPFPLSLLAGLAAPVAALLAPDLVMPAAFAAGDLVLLDQNPDLRLQPDGGGCWVVEDTSGLGSGLRAGLRIRYLRAGNSGQGSARAGETVEIACEAAPNEPLLWQPLPLQGRNILEIVRARIVWIGREMEKEPGRSPDTAGPGDRTPE